MQDDIAYGNRSFLVFILGSSTTRRLTFKIYFFSKIISSPLNISKIGFFTSSPTNTRRSTVLNTSLLACYRSDQCFPVSGGIDMKLICQYLSNLKNH